MGHRLIVPPFDGVLELPPDPVGVVVLAQGHGGVLTSPRAAHVASTLARAGVASLRTEMIDAAAESEPCRVHDVEALVDRLDRALHWLGQRPETAGLPRSLLGAGLGSAAALRLAARNGGLAAVVCHGGRPELAGEDLARVRVPVLLLAGIRNHVEVRSLRAARAALSGDAALILMPHPVRRTDEDHEFAAQAQVIRDWLRPRLVAARLGAGRSETGSVVLDTGWSRPAQNRSTLGARVQ